MLRLKRELRELLDARGTCVSIYLPTHRERQDLRADRARYKNLLRAVEGDLRAFGMRDLELDGLLSHARALAEDPFYWARQRGGLAVFIKEGFFREYRLPASFPETEVTNERFLLKPLLPVLGRGDLFHVLAASKKKLRLFQGGQFDAHEIDAGDMPESLADILREYERQPQDSIQTGARPVPGRPVAVYPGLGADTAEKTRLLEFFEKVDHGLMELLKNERSPLIFAGVEYEYGIFREVCSYPRLLSRCIPGNPDDLKAEDLHARAWPIVEPELRRDEAEELDLFHNLMGTGLTTDSIEEAVPAAYQGRVRVLFLERGVSSWGEFDGRASALELHEQRRPGDEDLLDRAACEALLKGASVRVLPRGGVPGAGPVAAVFRY